ncbi:MAG: magnesium/cobalt transporter CorA [Nitrincola lacisaponensis]|uniref:magnesium/cobalt transporter CorA n=1 Tax=Nitrincola lacisaponensis TaxID=267850 RepID=UPI00391DA9B3
MAHKLVIKRSKKAGLAPGTLVHVGQHSDAEVKLQVMDYNAHQLQEYEISNPADCTPLLTSDTLSWINVNGSHQVPVIESLGSLLQLHPLVMEDILNTDQRPKLEAYDGYLYIVVKMLQFSEASQEIHTEQLSLILSDRLLVSIQERPGDVFAGIRDRLRSGRRQRLLHADYLAYALIDAVVDHYFVLLEKLSDEIEALEDQLVKQPTPETLTRIHHFKREMLLLRKAVWPLRELLSRLMRDDNPLIREETRLYLRDVYDHTIHILDTIETLRELLVSMLDLYLSSVSNRMNDVMKTLTLIATLFMPLTFIAGVYGMNFTFMPELDYPWSYPIVLAFMCLVAIGLILYFRRRHWL